MILQFWSMRLYLRIIMTNYSFWASYQFIVFQTQVHRHHPLLLCQTEAGFCKHLLWQLVENVKLCQHRSAVWTWTCKGKESSSQAVLACPSEGERHTASRDHLGPAHALQQQWLLQSSSRLYSSRNSRASSKRLMLRPLHPAL